jgi:hypothetical protein
MNKLDFNATFLRVVLVGLLVILGTYLVMNHGQHLVPYLPFSFLLGCLVMHLFMHGGHDSGSGQEHR